jgi:hypothetical protein
MRNSTLKAMIRQSRGLRGVLAIPLAMRRELLKLYNRPYDRIFHALDNLLEGDVLLKVPEFSGTFQMSPRSHLFRRLVHEGTYEPELTRLFLSHIHPERDIIDVGANIGFFTVAGARALRTGRVASVEPTVAAFKRLRYNVEKNGVSDRTILINALLSDISGVTEITSVPDKEEYSSIGGIQHPSAIGLPSERAGSVCLNNSA